MTAKSRGATGQWIGRVINERYELRKCVGHGSMGEVYIAQHLQLDKEVAIKTILANAQMDPVVVGRFKSEARAASRLEHPNSVRIMDFGEEQDGLLYIVMEFLRGQDLSAVLKRSSRVSDLRVITIMEQVLSALTAAHQNNIVHRDLKPANIMLIKNAVEGTEVVKVCDFGIAKLQDPVSSEDPTGMMTMTRAGTVVGTPSYMSPEQAAGKKVDPRSDLFSCGVIMYHMLTGKKPFKADTLMGLLSQVMTLEPRPVEQCVSTTDPRLAEVVRRAMAKRPDQRFQSAREMRDALTAIRESAGDRTLSGAPAAQPEAAFSESLSSGPQARGITPLPMQGAAPRADSLGSSGSYAGGLGTGNHGQSQSFAGSSQTFVRTGTFIVPSPRRTTPMIAIGVLVFVLGAGAWWFSSRDAGSIAELQKLVQLDAWGAAEDYALKHYEQFEQTPEVSDLMADAMARRRTYYDTEKKLGITFDPSFQMVPSHWEGAISDNEGKKRTKCSLVIESVNGGRIRGYMDWPQVGVRVAIRGYSRGNHMVMWDYEFLHGKPRREEEFRMYEKVSILVEGGRMSAVDERLGTKFSAQKI